MAKEKSIHELLTDWKFKEFGKITQKLLNREFSANPSCLGVSTEELEKATKLWYVIMHSYTELCEIADLRSDIAIEAVKAFIDK